MRKCRDLLWAVEFVHPQSWRIAMSIEMCANVYPTRRLADEGANKYRRNGFPARVVRYKRTFVMPSPRARGFKR